MLTHPTLDQLKTLKLDGMADAFVELQAQDSSDELGQKSPIIEDRWTLGVDGSITTSRCQTRSLLASMVDHQASSTASYHNQTDRLPRTRLALRL